jgi:hypothetical protein
MFIRVKASNCIEEVFPHVAAQLINAGMAEAVTTAPEKATAAAPVETAALNPAQPSGIGRFNFHRAAAR